MNEHGNSKTPIKQMGHKQPMQIGKQFLRQPPNMLDSLRLYLSLEYFHVQLLEQELDLKILSERTLLLEQSIPKKPEVSTDSERKKKNRRLANDIEREFKCPYSSCGKSYGSEISLNLHIRIKHNGGSKIDRENLAKDIMRAQLRGDDPPESNIQLPPGFLDEFCQTYQEFLKKERQKLEQNDGLEKVESENGQLCQQNDIKNG